MTARPQQPDPSPSVDQTEIERFEAIADAWWDPGGDFAPLHKLNPVRLEYIRDHLCRHFDLKPDAARPLDGLSVLDIGCGGGLLCEPMARLGARVTGADASQKNIDIAALHARNSGLEIDYRSTTAEDLAAAGARFDVVLNMEVIEHVADVDSFLSACSALIKPGGVMFLATISRTFKSFAFAIVGTEYVLRWLPRGTHDWHRFLKPKELTDKLGRAGLDVRDLTGVSYDPLADRWATSRDLDVNYLMVAERLADGYGRDQLS
ncbi:MAG: bifunctional 2-polyprenyl-6-hydroxyphenol methylase/3-demethylubiquinol 3-O-methyltransferase UbiG [Sphingomonadales bacterium]